MGIYKIKIAYTTGNSFGSHDEEDTLELSWNDINIATENLKAIQEHYMQHCEVDRASNNKAQEIFAKNIDKFWFVNEPRLWVISQNQVIDEKHKTKYDESDLKYIPDSYAAEHCLKLKTDDGTLMQLSAFWIGYFERLNSVSIEIDNFKIEF